MDTKAKREVTISATVIKKDGTRIPLGVVCKPQSDKKEGESDG